MSPLFTEDDERACCLIVGMFVIAILSLGAFIGYLVGTHR